MTGTRSSTWASNAIAVTEQAIRLRRFLRRASLSMAKIAGSSPRVATLANAKNRTATGIATASGCLLRRTASGRASRARVSSRSARLPGLPIVAMETSGCAWSMHRAGRPFVGRVVGRRRCSFWRIRQQEVRPARVEHPTLPSARGVGGRAGKEED